MSLNTGGTEVSGSMTVHSSQRTRESSRRGSLARGAEKWDGVDVWYSTFARGTWWLVISVQRPANLEGGTPKRKN